MINLARLVRELSAGGPGGEGWGLPVMAEEIWWVRRGPRNTGAHNGWRRNQHSGRNSRLVWTNQIVASRANPRTVRVNCGVTTFLYRCPIGPISSCCTAQFQPRILRLRWAGNRSYLIIRQVVVLCKYTRPASANGHKRSTPTR
jgi:hypothetical protein